MTPAVSESIAPFLVGRQELPKIVYVMPLVFSYQFVLPSKYFHARVPTAWLGRLFGQGLR
jgi:hypothetical protein